MSNISRLSVWIVTDIDFAVESGLNLSISRLTRVLLKRCQHTSERFLDSDLSACPHPVRYADGNVAKGQREALIKQ